MLTGLTALDNPIDIAGNAALVGAINDFNTALTTMDNQARVFILIKMNHFDPSQVKKCENLGKALVGIIEGIDINSLIDVDGNFNTDALVTVFSTLDPTIVQALQDQFIAAIPSETMTTINSSMDAFLDLGTVFQGMKFILY